ncbi:MAG TPA: outer membrane beta-barrel protein [Polyangia bacterium]|nr:outer membrane beta-barrel protein [Polyangia bacterium]
MRTAILLAALAAPLLSARLAGAVGEREWQIALRAGAGTVSVDGRKPWGLAGGLDLQYGLTDAWALRMSFEASTHNVSKSNAMDMRPAGTIHTDAALVGLMYTFDVLRLVPYADLQAGVAQVGGAVVVPQTLLAMQLGVGADYFVSRQLTAGVAFHYLFEPADLLSDPLNLGTNPFSFTATARVSWIF